MRPKQWTKNLLLYAGIIFSLQAFNIELLTDVSLGFVIFCALSGSVYFLNDIVDRDKDRLHPKKKERPIAAGDISLTAAWVSFYSILTMTLTGAFFLNRSFFFICLIYFFLNIGYSFYLKRLVIIDVMIVAAGFVLRAMAGTVIINVHISPWLLICTLFLALFLSFCKRRNELLTMQAGTGNFREVLEQYTEELLDQMIAVATASSVMAYSLYTISPSVQERFHTENLFLTIPFVIFGIFRYLYLVHRENLGGNPEMILLKDVPIIIDVLLWICTVFLLLYFRY